MRRGGTSRREDGKLGKELAMDKSMRRSPFVHDDADRDICALCSTMIHHHQLHASLHSGYSPKLPPYNHSKHTKGVEVMARSGPGCHDWPLISCEAGSDGKDEHRRRHMAANGMRYVEDAWS